MNYNQIIKKLETLREKVQSFQDKYGVLKTRILLKNACKKYLSKYNLELPNSAKDIRKDTEALIRDLIYIINNSDTKIEHIIKTMKQKYKTEKQRMKNLGDN